MYLLIDLFSGLGGASEAFDNDPSWDVICFDNNTELIPHIDPGKRIFHYRDITDTDDIISVIMTYCDVKYEKIVIWASPPCNQWSNGYASPKSKTLRAGQEFIPDYACLDATWNIIKHMSKYCLAYNIQFIYAIENVRGGIEFISDRLGFRWRQQVGQMFLWGNFPTIIVTDELKTHTKPDKRHSPIRANIRAKVPYIASKAFKYACVKQSTLF